MINGKNLINIMIAGAVMGGSAVIAQIIPDNPVNPSHANWIENTYIPPVDASSDDDIASKISKAYQDDPNLSENAKLIQVSVNYGVATLTGWVDNQIESNRVEAMAKSMKGVVRVINKVEIAKK